MANPLAQKPALAEDIASSPTKKTLLITGAGGFVGKKAAEKALADGDRVVAMLTTGRVRAVDGSDVAANVESVCVHGDSPSAVQIARTIRDRLEADGTGIRAFC